MAEEIWSEQGTTPARVEAALRDLLNQRSLATDGAFAPARVLNLVVVVDAEYRGEVENRLLRVGRYHPSRTIVCAVQARKAELDAWATLSFDDAVPAPGHLAIMRERVELEMGPQHLRGLASLVDPLLLPDLTTLIWTPHGHEAAVQALRSHAQILLVDSMHEPDLARALERAAEWSQDLYVVDLAWLRSTPWRERVAAAFDPPHRRAQLAEIAGVTVHHREDSQASAALFCGWLASRLGWKPEALYGRGGRLAGRARARRGEVALALEQAEMSTPGLCGVTIEMASGEAISLNRAPGGLRAVRRARDGSERTWTVLGASRGEGGILGEGVRQALLRDPTYRPALVCARGLVAR